jgi:hypothetical protein
VKTTKRTLDIISALFWFVLGLLVCYGGTLLGLGKATDPGSGFIFFWSGLLMAFLSLMVLADSLREVGEEGDEFSGTNWVKLFLVLAALVLYGLLLERLGFVLTTFLLFSFLLRISEETKWPIVLTVAGAAALGSYALFELWLQVRLPKAIIGL